MQNWDYGWAGSYFVTICTRDKEYYFGDVVDGKMIMSGVGIIADILWHEIKNHGKNVELGEFVVMPDHIHGILILNETGGNNDNDNDNNNDNNDDNDNDDDNDDDNEIVETTHALSLPHPLIVPNALSVPVALSNPHPLIVPNGLSVPVALSDPHPLTDPVALSNPNPLPDPDALSNPNALSIPSPQSAEQTIGQKRFQHQGKNTLSSIIGAYKSAVTKHAHRLGMEFGWQPRFHDHLIQDDSEYRRISQYILNNPAKWHHRKFNKSI